MDGSLSLRRAGFAAGRGVRAASAWLPRLRRRAGAAENTASRFGRAADRRSAASAGGMPGGAVPRQTSAKETPAVDAVFRDVAAGGGAGDGGVGLLLRPADHARTGSGQSGVSGRRAGFLDDPVGAAGRLRTCADRPRRNAAPPDYRQPERRQYRAADAGGGPG